MASCCATNKKNVKAEFELPTTNEESNIPSEQPPMPAPILAVTKEPELQHSSLHSTSNDHQQEIQTHKTKAGTKNLLTKSNSSFHQSESAAAEESSEESQMSYNQLEALNEHLIQEIQQYQDMVKRQDETIRQMRDAELRQIEAQTTVKEFVSAIPQIPESSSENSDYYAPVEEIVENSSRDTQSDPEPKAEYKELLKQKFNNVNDFLAYKTGLNDQPAKQSLHSTLTKSSLKYTAKKPVETPIEEVEVLKIDLSNILQKPAGESHSKYIVDEDMHSPVILEASIKGKHHLRTKKGRIPLVTEGSVNTSKFQISPRHQSLYATLDRQ